MKLHLILCALFLNGFLPASRADEAPAVELRLHGNPTAISESAQKQLNEQAIHLVQSSNFHSGTGDEHHFFTLHGVQSDYRQTVAGKFLVVAFPTAQKIKTVGGEISVSEIVIGLNRGDYASSLFTVDESGAVVGHSKYSGEQCVEILKTVQQFNQ